MINDSKIKISIIVFIILIVAMLTYNYATKEKPKDLDNEKRISEISKENNEYDDLINKLEYKLTSEDKMDLINSSSCKKCMSEELLGSMFTINIPSRFKMMYVLKRITYDAFELDENYMIDNYGTPVTLKRSTIEKYGKVFFDNFEIPSSKLTNVHYYGINNVTCDLDNCSYTYETFGLVDLLTDGYEIKYTEENNTSIVNTIYLEYSNFTSITDETVTATVSVKASHTGVELKPANVYNLKLKEGKYDPVIFNTVTANSQTLSTYKYVFTDKQSLISVEKL